jgi:hypothetical protein
MIAVDVEQLPGSSLRFSKIDRAVIIRLELF